MSTFQVIKELSKNKTLNATVWPDKLLREYRLKTGLTQTQLAQAIGLKSLRMIQYWEAGSSLPKAYNLKKLIETFIAYHSFIDGQELEEIDRLWTTVSEASETQILSPSGSGDGSGNHTYPALDKTWVEKLLASQQLPKPAISTSEDQLQMTKLTSTPLVGRQQEVTDIKSMLLKPEIRLVTLTGSGGVGKTRLALEIADQLQASFKDGIFLVPLAALHDAKLVVSTVATTLNIRESNALSVIDLIKIRLQNKNILLVLDNFEQVLTASGLVNDLLADLPRLKILITSRSLLRVYGEYEYIVPTLSLPGLPRLNSENKLPSLPQLIEYAAIALFVQRAQAANSAFKLTNENARVVIEICQRLDGLPLALELAAAWIKILTPQLILERLGHRLQLLNRGPQDLPQRQQTLRALLDWSFELLNGAEKNLFINLAVFSGGADLQAIEEICQDSSNKSETLNLLSDLADKSMLQIATSTSGEIRFSLLEIMREYALEKLKSAGTEEILRERYSDYFLKLAEEATPALETGHLKRSWLDRLEIEHDNYRAVLDWLIGESRPKTSKEKSPVAMSKNIPDWKFNEANLAKDRGEMALHLSVLLSWFWDAQGYLSEGRDRLEKALKFSKSEDLLTNSKNSEIGYEVNYWQLRAKAFYMAGVLAYKQGDYKSATKLVTTALELGQTLDDPPEIAKTLTMLGILAYFEEDYSQAQKFYEESLSIFYRLGDKQRIGITLNNLAELVRERGDVERAIVLFEECLSLSREVGDTRNVGVVMINLGVVIGDQGDFQRAATILKESLKLFGELGDKFNITENLERLAGLAKNRIEAEQAARLLGAADNIRQAINAPVSEKYRSRHERAIKSVQSLLDPGLWQKNWAAGCEMTVEEVIDYALNEFSTQHTLEKPESTVEVVCVTSLSNPVVPANPVHPGSGQGQLNPLPDGLTLREFDVIKLLATGLTTAQIAQKLILSPLTVQAHLRSIYSKLGVTSRSAATRYAFENKLV